jgi:hypothetical protein
MDHKQKIRSIMDHTLEIQITAKKMGAYSLLLEEHQ